MNKKTVFTIISIVTLLGGLALGAFTDVLNDLPALALSAFGLGVLVITAWNKSEKKGGVLLASIICMLVCGIAAAFAEMSQDNFQKLIAAGVALVALIVGILVPVISKAVAKKD
jgi:peptidoglycan/LPS O-acetylase OafA/YrhL